MMRKNYDPQGAGGPPGRDRMNRYGGRMRFGDAPPEQQLREPRPEEIA